MFNSYAAVLNDLLFSATSSSDNIPSAPAPLPGSVPVPICQVPEPRAGHSPTHRWLHADAHDTPHADSGQSVIIVN